MNDEQTQVKLCYEPDNNKDCNAVVTEGFLQEHWKIIGYILAKKLEKVHHAIEKKQLLEASLQTIAYTFYASMGKHFYIPTITLVKYDTWLPNDENYECNDIIEIH